jgi:hypothetical protein
MYAMIICISKEKSMKNHAKVADKKQLSEKGDELTAKNRRCFLGVLNVLSFVQKSRETGSQKCSEKRSIAV